MKFLIAPDKFKHALSAREAAEALAAGVRDALPEATIDCCPLGDGGEGTGELLAERSGAEERAATALDPRGRPRSARWWCIPHERTAILELAEASGLCLLAKSERSALHTTSYGTGQLIRAALESGCTALTLAIGGSAMVDGGAGCLQALGVELIDSQGRPLDAPATGETLSEIAEIRLPPRTRFGLRVLCDVDNPLLGNDGAAPVYGPQKGATPDQIARLEEGLANWARVLQAATGRDVSNVPGAGAAGGIAAGLHAALGAALVPGARAVAWECRVFDRLLGCDLCLTGEGRIDAQTSRGKVVKTVAELAMAQNVPPIAFVGSVDPPKADLKELAARIGLREIVVTGDAGAPLATAIASAAPNLRKSVRDWLARRRTG